MNLRDQSVARGSSRFETTQWSLILKAANSNLPDQQRAMEQLCCLYWYPVYVFIRRQGMSAGDAEDRTQDFFHKMVSEPMLIPATPEKGRFRSYLLTCCKHALVNHWERERTQKRGGGQQFLHIDLEAAEAFLQQEKYSVSSEHDFDRQWALTLLRHVEHELERDYRDSGKEAIFAILRPHLLKEADRGASRQLALSLGVTEGNLHVMVHRLRRRYRELLLREVAATLDDPADVKEEIQHLMKALAENEHS